MQNEKNRKLTSLEQFLLKMSLTRNFIFLITAEFKGEISIEKLKQSVHSVKKQHYYLNVSVNLKEEPEFVYDEEKEIPFKLVPMNNVGELLDLTENELDEPFDFQSGPFLRITLLMNHEKAYLVLCFNHFISDAVSGMKFLEQVLETYKNGVSGVRMNQHEIFSDIQYFPKSVFGIRGLFKQISFIFNYLYSSVTVKKKNLPESLYIPYSERKNMVLHKVIPSELTDQIVGKCREESTSVQGALCAAFTFSFAETIKNNASIKTPAIDCASVINSRKYCRISIPDEQLGMWAGQILTNITIDPDKQFWEVARLIKRKILKDLKHDNMFLGYQIMLKGKYSTDEDLVRVLENSRPYIEMSNLGVISLPDNCDGLILEKAHFTVGIRNSQAGKWGITVDALTFKGELLLNAIMLKNYWIRGEAEKLLNHAVDILLKNCKL